LPSEARNPRRSELRAKHAAIEDLSIISTIMTADLPECVSCREQCDDALLYLSPCGHKFCNLCFEPGITSFNCPAPTDPSLDILCNASIEISQLIPLAAANPDLYDKIAANIQHIDVVEQRLDRLRRK
jgi:hypothetical protein